jgi:hypothetical protein
MSPLLHIPLNDLDLGDTYPRLAINSLHKYHKTTITISRLTFTNILENLRLNPPQRRPGVKGAARDGWYGETSAENTLGSTRPQDAGNIGPGAQDVHDESPWKNWEK